MIRKMEEKDISDVMQNRFCRKQKYMYMKREKMVR